jgi:hypothetical protein
MPLFPKRLKSFTPGVLQAKKNKTLIINKIQPYKPSTKTPSRLKYY